MIWFDFFLQALVSALAWLVAVTIWIVAGVLVAQAVLLVASKWPFGGVDPEDYP